eukprot:3772014-Pleurochrysis_carterae.AAC.1
MVDASTQSKPLDALIDALIRERAVARSFGQAATRLSDPYLGVEHHHTPHRANGSGVSTVSKPFGPDMVNTPTERKPLDNRIPPLKLSISAGSPPLAILRTNLRHRRKHRHTPRRASGSGRTSEATVPS